MSVNTEPYTNGAAQAREATEKSVETWKRGAKALTEQVDLVARLPKFDLTEPVVQYFEYLQQIFDINRELATRWAELVTSLTGTVQDQAEKVGSVVIRAGRCGRRPRSHPGPKGRGTGQRAGRVGRRGREGGRTRGQAGRAGRRQAGSGTGPGSPTRGCPRIELSDQLAERGLPKTGTVEELIERLVSADSE